LERTPDKVPGRSPFGVATLNEKLAYHQITAGLSYKF
jgi:hypothetical protein